MTTSDFILASSSPQRLRLLEQIGFVPKLCLPADIDETPKKHEAPTAYVKRMALEKAQEIAKKYPNENIFSGDTIIVLGKTIVQKANTPEEQTQKIKAMSGRSHYVLSAICLIDKKGKARIKCVSTRVIIKRLSDQEIKEYVDKGEWKGCCGYKIEASFIAFVQKIIGSYSGIVGLPLFETNNMLKGVGIK